MITEQSLKEIARLFFKLGCIGFGGPAAHIALMEKEIVKKRQWMTQEHFLDLIGATNLIPGPNSTEMAMHCGFHRGGWKGLLVAGSCFILPATLITGVIAYMYLSYGNLPQAEPFIYGIKPAVISLIAALMFSLAKKALKSWELGIAGIIAILMSMYGVGELYILFGISIAGVVIYQLRKKTPLYGFLPAFIIRFDWELFWPFLKIGSLLYGSGYVLFAYLNTELVASGKLSAQALVDAIAVGQITPGPVFSSATFIGWQIAGPSGAIAATLGIFLPSFLFVALLNPLIPKLRRSKSMSVFLDYVNITSVALIVMVCAEMTRSIASDWRSVIIGVLGFLITFRFRQINSFYIILGGAVLGYILY